MLSTLISAILSQPVAIAQSRLLMLIYSILQIGMEKIIKNCNLKSFLQNILSHKGNQAIEI
jgi:hypothetical protein